MWICQRQNAIQSTGIRKENKGWQDRPSSVSTVNFACDLFHCVFHKHAEKSKPFAQVNRPTFSCIKQNQILPCHKKATHWKGYRSTITLSIALILRSQTQKRINHWDTKRLMVATRSSDKISVSNFICGNDRSFRELALFTGVTSMPAQNSKEFHYSLSKINFCLRERKIESEKRFISPSQSWQRKMECTQNSQRLRETAFCSRNRAKIDWGKTFRNLKWSNSKEIVVFIKETRLFMVWVESVYPDVFHRSSNLMTPGRTFVYSLPFMAFSWQWRGRESCSMVPFTNLSH